MQRGVRRFTLWPEADSKDQDGSNEAKKEEKTEGEEKKAKCISKMKSLEITFKLPFELNPGAVANPLHPSHVTGYLPSDWLKNIWEASLDNAMMPLRMVNAGSKWHEKPPVWVHFKNLVACS